MRSAHKISDLITRKTKLKRHGREFKGLCAFHEERSPSMQVSDAKGMFYCFGCGASGDAIRFVMMSEGLSFMDALRFLGAADLPAYDPAERTKAAAEDESDRLASIAEARTVWEQAGVVAGTAAAAYLHGRGITVDPGPAFRFTRTYCWRDKDTGETGPDIPALLGAVTLHDEVVAIQRIFIKPDGSGKAAMRNPKRTLGRALGGAIKLGSTRHGATADVIMTEGPEDGLSIWQDVQGVAVWIALGTGFMPMIEFAPDQLRICVAGQNDDAGRAATAKAVAALTLQGRVVSTMWPADGFKDWNDQLRGIAS